MPECGPKIVFRRELIPCLNQHPFALAGACSQSERAFNGFQRETRTRTVVVGRHERVPGLREVGIELGRTDVREDRVFVVTSSEMVNADRIDAQRLE